MRLVLVLMVLSGVVSVAEAADYDAMVKRAFEVNATTSLEDWTYTETYSSGAERQVATYDPCRSEDSRWELQTVNGLAATAEENEQFVADKRESDERGDDESGFDIVTPGSLKLIEETDQAYHFGFQPTSDESDEDSEIMRHVNGRLSVNKALGFVESIRFFSDKPFKPETGVKVKEMDIAMTFGATQPDDAIVLMETTSHIIKGRAYMVVSFDEQEKTTFSKFSRAACVGTDG